MIHLLALALALVALQQYESSVGPLPAPLERNLGRGESWRPGCPVPLSDLRLLTVRHWDFDGRERLGQLVVRRDAAPKLAKVFHSLYAMKFPIRHMKTSAALSRVPSARSAGDGVATGRATRRTTCTSLTPGAERSRLGSRA